MAGAHQGFLLELYSGYAFARFVNAGTSANLSGGLGSFGWNLKPWLQLVGDSSYNFATTNGAKSVLYGNHFGGRAYYRRGRFGMGRIGVTPFAGAFSTSMESVITLVSAGSRIPRDPRRSLAVRDSTSAGVNATSRDLVNSRRS